MQIGSGSKAPSSRLASGRLEPCYALNKIQQCGKRLVNIRVGCIIIAKSETQLRVNHSESLVFEARDRRRGQGVS